MMESCSHGTVSVKEELWFPSPDSYSLKRKESKLKLHTANNQSENWQVSSKHLTSYNPNFNVIKNFFMGIESVHALCVACLFVFPK